MDNFVYHENARKIASLTNLSDDQAKQGLGMNSTNT
jgi:hypothetical protein